VIAVIARDRRDRESKFSPRRRGDTENEPIAGIADIARHRRNRKSKTHEDTEPMGNQIL